MEDEEVATGPLCAPLNVGGGCFGVSLEELAAEVDGGAAGREAVEGPRDVHDLLRPAEKLGLVAACRSCTSRSALQAR